MLETFQRHFVFAQMKFLTYVRDISQMSLIVTVTVSVLTYVRGKSQMSRIVSVTVSVTVLSVPDI